MISPLPPRTWHAVDVVRVFDGDTFTGQVRLPLGDVLQVQVRLAGIDAPERRGATAAAGLRARARLLELLEGGVVSIWQPFAWLEKYGRVLAWVRVRGEGGEVLVNDVLEREGLARRYLVDRLTRPA